MSISSGCVNVVDGSVESLLRKVAASEGIRNPRFEINKASARGDNFLGLINAVKIVGEKVLSVIVKTAPADEECRRKSHIKLVYHQETYFYDTIYPTYLNLQKEKGVDELFTNIAKCYATSMEELNEGLVLENLRDQGYQLWDRKKPMNAEHMSFILKVFARFHAVGYALKDQKPELYNEISSNVVNLYEIIGDDPGSNEAFIEQLLHTADMLKSDMNKQDLERFKKFIENLTEYQQTLRTKYMDQYTVLTHGDSWCNNMMFKYEDGDHLTKPTNMRLLDWQIMRIASPIFDFTYIFYTSGSKEVLDDYKHYMNIYYDTLSAHLKNLGSDPEKLYPRRVFEQHYKKYCPQGLSIALFMIKVLLSEQEEAPDLSNDAKGETMTGAFDYVPKSADYKPRLRDVILHFIRNDFI